MYKECLRESKVAKYTSGLDLPSSRYSIFDLEEAQMLYVLHADGGHLSTTNVTIKCNDYFMPPLLPKSLQD